MLFQIKNRSNGNTTHCSVLQFSAPEGNAFLPYWMMSNLMLPENGLIQVGTPLMTESPARALITLSRLAT